MITYGSIFVRNELSYTWMIWSEDYIGHTIHRIDSGGIDSYGREDGFKECIELRISIARHEVSGLRYIYMTDSDTIEVLLG